MKRLKIKDEQLLIKLTSEQKKEIRNLAELSNKSMSDLVLDAVLNTSTKKAQGDIIGLLKEHFTSAGDFQKQQQITMHIILQFAMWAMSQSKTREEIMDFYKDIHESAKEKFSEQ